jgi:hypothetical protein
VTAKAAVALGGEAPRAPENGKDSAEKARSAGQAETVSAGES